MCHLLDAEMKIIAPYAYFAPEQAASSYLWQNLHEDFAKNGIDCVVYVPIPSRGISIEVREDYKQNRRVEYLHENRLKVVRFALYGEGRNPIARALRYVISCIWQYMLCLKGEDSRNASVLFMASTPPIIGIMGAMVRKKRGIPFVYNLQDIFPDSLISTGLAKKNGILWKIGRTIENFTYKHADKIIVISEGFKKNLMAKGVPESKIEVVYNWVDEEAVISIPRNKNKLFARYNLDSSNFYVTYNGNIGHTQNMDMLLEVASDLKQFGDIHFVIVGDGAYHSKVKHIITNSNLTNVHLLPFQPYEDISHVFSLGDVSIVISKPGVGNNSVPSKTWSIMSASRPVLANFDENELKDILENNKCGIFTKAGDKEAFTAAILKLYKDKTLCNEYGKNGREYILKNLTRSISTKKYIDIISSVVK